MAFELEHWKEAFWAGISEVASNLLFEVSYIHTSYINVLNEDAVALE